ncbi:MAG: arsenite methyltransferase [Chloroflexi bacterium]|nr:arsenite methyltransferase [Chloroflexota bacterium]
MTQLNETDIKEVVKERYGNLARDASSGQDTACCGDDCCGSQAELDAIIPLYTNTETEGLPIEALAASAGCGNPTALASLKPGETVVDFGSGGGIDCFLAAREVGESGRVIGIDMTEDMVNLANSNARKLGLSNAEFHLADIDDTPLEDDTADIVISNCVINLVPDKDSVFQEAFRILKPGGRMMISDMVLVEDIPTEEKEDTANWVACLAGAEMKDVYLGRMKAAGFMEIQVASETPLEDDEGWRAGVRSMNIQASKPS